MATETLASGKDQLRRSIDATDKAIRMIREGDLKRRQISLELRDLQLTMHEDFEQIKNEMSEFDEKAYNERTKNAKWIAEKLEKAKKEAEQAIKSNLLSKDVQILEKKIGILKESMNNVNKAYYKYDNSVDLKDLMRQITEMSYRTQKRENALVCRFQGEKLENRVEETFRGAVEGLLALKSSNPSLIAEARLLANELRVYRDIAANENFVELISRAADNDEAKMAAATTTTTTTTTTSTSLSSLMPSESTEMSTLSTKSKAMEHAPLTLKTDSSATPSTSMTSETSSASTSAMTSTISTPASSAISTKNTKNSGKSSQIII